MYPQYPPAAGSSPAADGRRPKVSIKSAPIIIMSLMMVACSIYSVAGQSLAVSRANSHKQGSASFINFRPNYGQLVAGSSGSRSLKQRQQPSYIINELDDNLGRQSKSQLRALHPHGLSIRSVPSGRFAANGARAMRARARSSARRLGGSARNAARSASRSLGLNKGARTQRARQLNSPASLSKRNNSNKSARLQRRSLPLNLHQQSQPQPETCTCDKKSDHNPTVANQQASEQPSSTATIISRPDGSQLFGQQVRQSGEGAQDLRKLKQDGFSVGLGPLEFAVKTQHEELESARFNQEAEKTQKLAALSNPPVGQSIQSSPPPPPQQVAGLYSQPLESTPDQHEAGHKSLEVLAPSGGHSNPLGQSGSRSEHSKSPLEALSLVSSRPTQASEQPVRDQLEPPPTSTTAISESVKQQQLQLGGQPTSVAPKALASGDEQPVSSSSSGDPEAAPQNFRQVSGQVDDMVNQAIKPVQQLFSIEPSNDSSDDSDKRSSSSETKSTGATTATKTVDQAPAVSEFVKQQQLQLGGQSTSVSAPKSLASGNEQSVGAGSASQLQKNSVGLNQALEPTGRQQANQETTPDEPLKEQSSNSVATQSRATPVQANTSPILALGSQSSDLAQDSATDEVVRVDSAGNEQPVSLSSSGDPAAAPQNSRQVSDQVDDMANQAIKPVQQLLSIKPSDDSSDDSDKRSSSSATKSTSATSATTTTTKGPTLSDATNSRHSNPLGQFQKHSLSRWTPTTRISSVGFDAKPAASQPAPVLKYRHQQTTSNPLYQSTKIGGLSGKCRAGLFELVGAINELLALVERVGQKILLDESVSYITRDVLSRRLAKIRIGAEESRMAANLANLRALNESARSTGVELMRLANSQVAHQLDPSLRPFALKVRRLYGLYRKSCKSEAGAYNVD